ncbi:MAG TPA: ribonuclease H-like domain-containing protein [Candidatus Dormibacteraeota bacterium]|nr:ribonuclease H-like domain-containing protein [Candidatus Dormibacteraeota bacterium]
MLLRERLESLGRPTPVRRHRPDADLEGLASSLGGEVRENACGPYVVVEAVHAMPPTVGYNAASALFAGVAGEEPLRESGLCFFDTETTGLSGGVGTQVFLMATAWRVPNGLVVRQYLLADPVLEDGFLEAVEADLASSCALVSYNGRSFDSPVLEGRLVLSRRSPDCLRRPHLDLLHPARRVFRWRLGQCNLQSVEAMVLGQDRGEDIPGYLIPELYFAYLRSRDPELLRAVVAHNRQDVVSLSLLLDHLVEVIAGRGLAHPLDRMGVGRLLESAALMADAARVYQALWDEPSSAWDGEVWPGSWTPVELRYVVGLRLATLRRRAQRPDLAQAVLEQLWQRHQRPWEAGIMLAKDLEHRRKDGAAALEVASAARLALDDQPGRTPQEERWLADLVRRTERLRRRTGEAA